MTTTPSAAPQNPDGWEKPSVYSVLIIASVLALIGYALHLGKLTFTESLLSAVLGIVTWVARGARPPVVNKIGGGGSKPPPPPDPPSPPPPPPSDPSETPIRDRMETPREPPPSSTPRLRCHALALALALVACTPGQRQVARDVLSIMQVACIIANAESDDAHVLQICGIGEALLPEVQTLLGEQRKAIARVRRTGCRPGDAGP